MKFYQPKKVSLHHSVITIPELARHKNNFKLAESKADNHFYLCRLVIIRNEVERKLFGTFSNKEIHVHLPSSKAVQG